MHLRLFMAYAKAHNMMKLPLIYVLKDYESYLKEQILDYEAECSEAFSDD